MISDRIKIGWRKPLKAIIVPVMAFATGLLIAGFVVTICFLRGNGDDYSRQTSIHAELYKSASCITCKWHQERKGRRYL